LYFIQKFGAKIEFIAQYTEQKIGFIAQYTEQKIKIIYKTKPPFKPFSLPEGTINIKQS
jgi:hypothetical protein